MLETEPCKDVESKHASMASSLQDPPVTTYACAFPPSLPPFKTSMDFSPSMVLPPPVALPAETGRSFAASPTSSATGGEELGVRLRMGSEERTNADKTEDDTSVKCGKVDFLRNYSKMKYPCSKCLKSNESLWCSTLRMVSIGMSNCMYLIPHA